MKIFKVPRNTFIFFSSFLIDSRKNHNDSVYIPYIIYCNMQRVIIYERTSNLKELFV